MLGEKFGKRKEGAHYPHGKTLNPVDDPGNRGWTSGTICWDYVK